ncbi:peptidoglycan-binding protein [Aliinostoc sp. HNIBRCY26]|uniref:peptidoglycan-binding protein n=1 Tax=Aliinostoc sp. HNIBRCY26 TaxID=3418997 RepID=UPI003D06FEAD
MESLAYLHLAESYAASADPEEEVLTDVELYFQELAWIKNHRGVLVLAACLAMVSLSSQNPAMGLKRGDRGSQVVSLQQRLQAAGYFQQNPTGYFGAVTEAAVIQFQQANGLKVDGVVGSKTLAALGSGSGVSEFANVVNEEQPKVVSKRSLKKGDNSYRVMSLQRKLQAAGYFNAPISGFFDDATRTAVIQFQQAKGLTVDGLAGKQTLSALESHTDGFNTTSFLAPAPVTKISDNSPQPTPKPQIQIIQPAAKVSQRPQGRMHLVKTISSSKISPKSVVYSGDGLFFAQNMMYNHSITVYNRDYKLVKVIPDTVDLSKYGYAKKPGKYRGAPVEASFSHNGKYAWVSNYQMYGTGFNNPGNDKCSPSQKTDNSFLYRINTDTLNIEQVIQVGSVPKFVAASPDEQLILVSNWCSWDLSVVDANQNQEIKRIKLGAYPRGIAINSTSETAYVAVMGSSDIAEVNLRDFSVKWIRNVGNSPRHLNIDPTGKYLYASLNGEGKIAKINLQQRKVIEKVITGQAPRSMVLNEDGQILYVVNYNENSVSKVRTSDMKVLQKVNVESHPIGITYDPQTREVWVACYSGNIMIFQD